MNAYEQVCNEVRPMSLRKVYARLIALGCSEIKQDRPRSASIGCILPNGVIFNCGDCRDLLIDMIVNPSEYAEPTPEQSILSFQDQTIEEGLISIEEQLEIWNANTPRWDNFPARDQSAIYVLGSSFAEDTLGGVILVFNARRHTVRAYPNTERNQQLCWKVGMLGRFGYIGNSIAYIHLLDGQSPNGIAMPRDLGRLHLLGGKSIYWAGGCAMLFPTPEERNTDQSDWADSIDDRLVENVLMGRLWGIRIDAWDDSMIDPPQPTIGKSDQIRAELSAGGYVESAKNAIIEWRNGREGYQWYVSIPRNDGDAPPIEMYWWDHSDGGFNFHFVLGASIRPIVPSEDDLLEYAALNGDLEQIPFNPEIKYPTAKQSPLLAELLAQWHWFNDLVNSAFESGDLDRAENAAVYAYALNGVAQNMFDRRFTF